MDKLLPFSAELVEPTRIPTEQGRAHRVPQHIGGHIQILDDKPPPEARQHHTPTSPFELAARIRQLERDALLADHVAVLERGLRMNLHGHLTRVKGLLPHVALERITRDLDRFLEDHLQLHEHILDRLAISRRRRLVEEARPGPHQVPSHAVIMVSDDIYPHRLRHHSSSLFTVCANKLSSMLPILNIHIGCNA